jgi:hypothetical protein
MMGFMVRDIGHPLPFVAPLPHAVRVTRALGGLLLTTPPQTAVRSRSDQKRDSGGVLHLHRYLRSGDDPFSGSSLYRCRCGVTRPGL